jgi:hypothetical protein
MAAEAAGEAGTAAPVAADPARDTARTACRPGRTAATGQGTSAPALPGQAGAPTAGSTAVNTRRPIRTAATAAAAAVAGECRVGQEVSEPAAGRRRQGPQRRERTSPARRPRACGPRLLSSSRFRVDHRIAPQAGDFRHRYRPDRRRNLSEALGSVVLRGIGKRLWRNGFGLNGRATPCCQELIIVILS